MTSRKLHNESMLRYHEAVVGFAGERSVGSFRRGGLT
jgi:hypothetical protein